MVEQGDSSKPNYSHFQGVPYPLFVKPEYLEKLASFETGGNDIFVATYPKSGKC